MTVENLMHPPKKCNCDCCCNCQPKTYGPLPKSENNFDSLNKLGEMISEVMQKGEKKTLSAAPQHMLAPHDIINQVSNKLLDTEAG